MAPPEPTAVTASPVVTTLAGREEAARLVSALDAAPVPLARLTDDGHLLAINRAAVALLGLERAAEGLTRRLWELLITPESDALERFVCRVSRGEAGTLELQARTETGSERILEISGTPLETDTTGRASGLFVLHDVGARRALELAAVSLNARAQADAAEMAEQARIIGVLQQRLTQAASERRAAEPPHVAPELITGPARPSVPAPAHPGVEPGALEARVAELDHAHARALEELGTLRRALEAQTARAQEADIERIALLRTAEYLEAQRAALAAERDAHAATIGALESEATRLKVRLQALETAHAQTLAGQASLQIELRRMRGSAEAGRHDAESRIAALEADLDTTRAELAVMTERHAVLEAQLDEQHTCDATAREALHGALADFEQLTAWSQACSSRLAAYARRQRTTARQDATDGRSA